MIYSSTQRYDFSMLVQSFMITYMRLELYT